MRPADADASEVGRAEADASEVGRAEIGGEQPLDVLIVSLGSTQGLRTADEELRESLLRAGASVAVARAVPPPPTRTLMLTDLAWARAARAAATQALAELRSPPRAIIYSSTTAALLWPRPGAIRFDAPAAGNRPGRHGVWQRPLERRRLEQAPLLLPWSEGGLQELPAATRRGGRALVVPVPVQTSSAGVSAQSSGPREPQRDIAAITYAANPAKKGLDRVLAAWRRTRGEMDSMTGLGAGELVVAGVDAHELTAAGFAAREQGVRCVGALAQADYRALLRRSRAFVCAPRREDYGIAQLEALADGCLLVSAPAPGPYVALPIARAIDPRLVSDDLEAALRSAFADPRADYAARARAALLPLTRDGVDRLVADALLPRLLGGRAA
jgi:hypothetical protein